VHPQLEPLEAALPSSFRFITKLRKTSSNVNSRNVFGTLTHIIETG